MSNFLRLNYISRPCDYRNWSHDFLCIPLEPITTHSNMEKMLVLKALNSLNMWSHMMWPPGLRRIMKLLCIPQTMHSPTTTWKLSSISEIISLHMNIFWPKLILFICSIQLSMIILFLLNGDSKCTYVFLLMINVVLRISHK
jgi:hypothetical protein